MNCERCQELIGDLIDGTLSGADESTLKSHLDECLDCVSVRDDLTSILSYCRANRGEYEAPPNEKALWLRIRNVVEAEVVSARPAVHETARRWWWNRSWELSFPISIADCCDSVAGLARDDGWIATLADNNAGSCGFWRECQR